MTKSFWRESFEKAGVYVAPEIARWNGKEDKLTISQTGKFPKAIIKVDDSCLGAGDKILDNIEL